MRRRQVNKQLVIGFLAGVVMLSGACSSYAERAGHRGRLEDIMREGMPPMRGTIHPGMGMLGIEHPMWRSLIALGLDDKQKEALQAIKHSTMKDMIKKRADEHIANIELEELLAQDPLNMSAVKAKLTQIETVRTEMHLALIGALEEAKSQLTAEQKKQFKTMPKTGSIMGPPGMGDMRHDRGRRLPPPPDRNICDEAIPW